MGIIEKTFETTRFFLEPISGRYAKVLFESLQSNQLYTYIPSDAPISIEALQVKYEMWEKRFSKDGNETWLNYAILDKTDNIYKGTLQATIIKNAETYIAYEVFPKYWNNGIAKECVSKMVNILIAEFNCAKISAHTDTRNIPSIGLLKSLGFIKVRKLDDADFFKGHTSHEFIFELKR